MKKKYNEGFSLVESLVAIAVLALIVIPCCSGIVMAFRMNAKADRIHQTTSIQITQHGVFII